MSAKACILVAEDEASDVEILRLALQRAGIPNPLSVTSDGKEAIAYLSGEVPFNDRSKFPLPQLLILDLKMPCLTGFDVLAWLRDHPQFRDLPAVVLTSSSHEQDMAKARALGAREYHVKPTSFQELAGILQQLANRWLETTHVCCEI
ncbi:MAG: two-component system response regulator [Verrucomicrobia bacterium]|nr:MAG: two-component system response regulator [Verrucomicrobiota bacterium]